MNLYVSNLPYSASEQEVESLFAEYGDVVSVKIILDRETRRSRGFGFVEMQNEEDASAAVEQLNGFEMKGREIQVKKAIPREEGGRDGGYRSTSRRRDY
ncbi:RNA recognition motif domain-containing protein [Hugenholtzia roseola]|uniref:RNA recognition motif domain-containing protein n=1 Tax=Hugenholtzia roseola TaxID=1002 RepID=UPI00047AF65D|nr:RNA-binding protein [Hugenholtzia roseola]